ncbi:unnamed protein product [Rotaria magnacalcarata]|uniref:Uncharacterized protein n=2 Tax=Rotaria magnacalcarata TaxID=392030 RepID=A0A816WQB2_9BILA|nr:unnamed protein product [Rotaria magnacalcarata]CAF1467089.1 unnamed protein product [Rotaria magnacalcarata]CAF2135256.1 unnamed protein product [Rotaria magnacalcarata]CAF2137139.1 unnamed protein product [Rotaria magnacalcarata]CAF2172568.1 unnamed protein product [Rotaria magnacalcarata]
MSNVMIDSYGNQSLFLPYYKNLLPKSIGNEIILSKKNSKRCSSSYRQRLERIKTNCQLIRQRRRRDLFPIVPIELRPSVFQQRSYKKGSLEILNVNDNHWQTTNFLRLSDEYLFKCKYAIYSSTNRYFKQNEFYRFLKEIFSCSFSSNEHQIDLNECQFCDSKFSSNEMFDLHLNRRSVSIQYRCLTCQSWIKSMNPCQAYYHLLLHNNSTKEKRIGQLNIHYNSDNYLNDIDDTFTNYSNYLSTD